MPEKSKKPCPYPGCTTLVDKGYCERHTRPVADNRPNSRKRGYTKAWERYRAAYLAKPENALCALRLDGGCAIRAECVDHIVPHKGDRVLFWDKGNHQPACLHCNSVKRDKTIKGERTV